MASSFPNSVDLFVPKINDVDDVLAEHVNDLQDATKAIEDYLLSQTPDQSQAPVSPGTGKVGQVLSWLANRIKAITGATNWWDSPAATQAALWAKFDPLTGHKHTGAAGDGPKLGSPNILYSSSVSGFTPADVKAALDALAGVRIVEKGSNANGEYVRWENGWQICARSYSFTARNSWQTVPCPAAFVDINYYPIATMRGGPATSGYAVVYVRSDNASNVGVYQRRDDAVDDPVYIVAIGRWK